MRTAIRGKLWLLLLPLLMLGSHLAVQAQRPPKSDEPPPVKEPEDPPALKLPALLAAKPLKEDRKDDEMRKLLKARYNEAVAEMKVLWELYRVGAQVPGEGMGVTVITLFAASSRLVQAGLEVFDKHEDRITLLTQHVELAREAEKVTEAMDRARGISPLTRHRVRYYRLDAEIQLLRYKREAGKGKAK